MSICLRRARGSGARGDWYVPHSWSLASVGLPRVVGLIITLLSATRYPRVRSTLTEKFLVGMFSQITQLVGGKFLITRTHDSSLAAFITIHWHISFFLILSKIYTNIKGDAYLHKNIIIFSKISMICILDCLKPTIIIWHKLIICIWITSHKTQ